MPAREPDRAGPLDSELRTLTRVEGWSDSDGAASGGASPEFDCGPSEERYRLESFLGEGAMGEVYRGRDELLRRVVALKYLRAESSPSVQDCEHFWTEAVTSGGLGHPSIPPVHDVGIDSSGRPFYVMQLIEGRSLRQVLSEDAETRWRLPRLLSIFLQVCGAVQFAHDRETLHLDIKPDNVMVGEYGDVYLVDWGLSESVTTAKKGLRRGTPAYMSPEQATGEPATKASDVFSLGALLYEMVTGARAFPSVPDTPLLDRIREAKFDRGAPWSTCPDQLRSILSEALARTPSDRIESARDLADRVQSFVDGRDEERRRRIEAERFFQSARELLGEDARLRARIEALRTTVTRAPKSWDPPEAKHEFWDAQIELEDLEARSEVMAEEAYQLLSHAQRNDPDHPEIRKACADLLWPRFEIAERNRDVFQQRFLQSQLAALRLPEIDGRLSGEGEFSLVTTPAFERATLSVYRENRGVLIPIETRELSDTPSLALEMGSYLVRAECSGYRPLSIPVHIGRQEQCRLAIRFRRESEVGSEFIQIPSGEFWMGGDDQTLKSVPFQKRLVGDFAIARFPVTFAQYRDFLAAVARIDLDHARTLLPTFIIDDTPVWTIDESGPAFGRNEAETETFERWPVFEVTYSQARAYCEWRSAVDGRLYDLPTDEEWEKAARGVDARTYPWGPRYDASFCKNSGSTETKAQPEPVGRYETDCSPYGVRDMAGGIREWCSSWIDEKDGLRVVRGGSWNFGSVAAHCAYRLGCDEEQAYPFIGFRIVHRFC